MRDFRELKVWDKAHKLCLSVYKVTEKFPSEEKFGLISQLRRSSSSVPTNISEACGYETAAEFSRFLKIASGSISEVEYLIILSRDLNFIDQPTSATLIDEATVIRKMLYKLRVSQK